MKIIINDKKEAQCPSCGKFNKLVLNELTTWHEFKCNNCRRHFTVFIDKDELEGKRKEEEKIRRDA